MAKTKILAAAVGGDRPIELRAGGMGGERDADVVGFRDDFIGEGETEAEDGKKRKAADAEEEADGEEDDEAKAKEKSKRQKAAIGLHHAVHQRFSEDPKVFGIHNFLCKS